MLFSNLTTILFTLSRVNTHQPLSDTHGQTFRNWPSSSDFLLPWLPYSLSLPDYSSCEEECLESSTLVQKFDISSRVSTRSSGGDKTSRSPNKPLRLTTCPSQPSITWMLTPWVRARHADSLRHRRRPCVDVVFAEGSGRRRHPLQSTPIVILLNLSCTVVG